MDQSRKRVIVVSAINFFEGGPLTILKETLKFANDVLAEKYSVIALVHKKKLFLTDGLNNIIFFEFPKSRASYIFRLYYEYFYFKKLSVKWNPKLWFSLHDVSQNVKADIRAVYCHNPSPLKKTSINDLKFQPAFFLFSLFYKWLYLINIKKNNYVVVQQKWIKEEFIKFFKLKPEKVIVSYPHIQGLEKANPEKPNTQMKIFIYPALPRHFKNYEVIGEAVKILNIAGYLDFNVVFTISGNENKYAKFIFKKYGNLSHIRFVGNQNKAELFSFYENADALIFPSKLETWGLPITEFKNYDKPIILADLPYAHETLGKYSKASFFDVNDPRKLSEKMIGIINGSNEFDLSILSQNDVLVGWGSLYDKILND